MKKITLLVSLISFSLSHAAIIVKDIPDFTFTSNSTLDFDFNSDGTIEFSFEEMSGVGTFFDSNNVNFVGCGTLSGGYGWDVLKSLNLGTVISSASSFDAQGDAYINPGWANSNNFFPAGDSYIGTKFKIGASTYYGWILVSSTGGSTGVITVKSYAYNNVANGSITAGQALGVNDLNSDFELKVYPNPTTDYVYIKTEKTINSVSVHTANGEVIKANIDNNMVDFSQFSSGIYFLNFISEDNERMSVKLIKK